MFYTSVTVNRLPCNSSPCLNRGVCINNGDRYSCRCTSFFTGVRCEKRISSKPTYRPYICINRDPVRVS